MMAMPSLVKLIDEALIPAILLIVAKIAGVLFVNYYFSLPWNFVGSSVSYKNIQDFLLANSYSNLLMYSVILVGLSWVLIKAHYMHDTHIHPTVLKTLTSLNMAHLVGDTFKIYHQAIVWVSYLWLTTGLFGVQAYIGLCYSWVFVIALVFACVSTVLFVVDIEREFTFGKASRA